MTLNLLVIAGTTFSLVPGATASTLVKHLKRHRHVGHVPVLPSPPVPSAWSGPQMIEAKPGVWVPTWDNIVDEGKGRWMLESHEP
jgi:hypothetical protein